MRWLVNRTVLSFWKVYLITLGDCPAQTLADKSGSHHSSFQVFMLAYGLSENRFQNTTVGL